jgi:hypothetical protein
MTATTKPELELGSSPVQAPEKPAWHGLTVKEACAQLGVAHQAGLDPAKSSVGERSSVPTSSPKRRKSPAGTRSCASTAT